MEEFKNLIGKTFTQVTISPDKDEVIFICDNGESYKLYHDQDCCESVYVEDVIGELKDLLNSPLLMADESSNSEDEPKGSSDWPDDSYTWTFYKLATINGYVTIRWYGCSNGYYSESVSFCKL